jgi:hypothetical protein
MHMDGHGALDDDHAAGYAGPPTNGPDDEQVARPGLTQPSASDSPQYFSERDLRSSAARNTSIPMVLYPLPVDTSEQEVSMFKSVSGRLSHQL